MGIAPRRPCSFPRCPHFATVNSRCADHQRPSAAQRGYTGSWAAYARAWLLRYPFCGMRADGQLWPVDSLCARRGLFVAARVVDHIVSLRMGGALWDPFNHQSLCVSCNTRKG